MPHRAIAYPKVSCHQKSAIKVTLRWFKKHCDTLIGEEIIDNISLQDIQDMFNIYIDNEVFNVWHVKTRQARKLQKITRHNIQISKFSYFIEQEGDFSGLIYKQSDKVINFNDYHFCRDHKS